LDDILKVIFELLRADGSIIVNKVLAREIGLPSAILYSELISKYLYFSKKGTLNKDGYFFNTVENMQEDTCLSDYHQREAIGDLKKLGLIDCKVKGVPPKRYFKILTDIKASKILTDLFLRSQEKVEKKAKELSESIIKNSIIENQKFEFPTNNTKNNPKFIKKSNFETSFKKEEDNYIPDYDPSKKKDIDNRTPEELKRDQLRIAELAHQARIEMSRKEMILIK